jgi:hypothetical protein
MIKIEIESHDWCLTNVDTGEYVSTWDGPYKDYKEEFYFTQDVDKLISSYRITLWMYHGCPLPTVVDLFGELKCEHCGIDFKNTPIDDLKTQLYDKRIK